MAGISLKMAAVASSAALGTWTVAGSASEAAHLHGAKLAVEPDGGDSHISASKAATMSEPVTRAEMEANFRTVKAEADAARQHGDSKIEQVLSAISGLKESLGYRIDNLAEKLEGEVESVKEDNKTTRRVTLVTIIVSVIAAIGAIYAAQANNIAALQVGLDAGSAPVVEAAVAAPAPAPKYDAQTGKLLTR